MHRLFSICLLLVSGVSSAEFERIEHKIPPGYTPSDAQDEQGLWHEIEEYERQLNKSALLVDDREIVDYISQLTCRVAGDYCNDIRIYVVRNPGFNASMTATGMMQIWTGLIVRSRSSDEIGAVIGHEIAHYTRLHTLERFRKARDSAAASSILDMGISVLTGVPSPFATTAAALGGLSFNREQEQEADLLGAQLLAEAALDPHAAYRVWQNIVAEEEAAAVKRRKPGMFSQTHPDAQSRIDVTKEFVGARYGPPDRVLVTDEALLSLLNNHYLFLMEDQIDTNRFGRTQALLERHSEMGVDPGQIYYFYGEMFRQRGGDGDRQLAMSAYRHSIETTTAPPDAHRNLGYLYLKEKDLDQAKQHFRQFLAAEPDASDREMIEFYLEQ